MSNATDSAGTWTSINLCAVYFDIPGMQDILKKKNNYFSNLALQKIQIPHIPEIWYWVKNNN